MGAGMATPSVVVGIASQARSPTVPDSLREVSPVGATGLLYVGAVLFLNGVMILGRVDAKAAAVFNLFVGGLQVLTPTYLIFTAGVTRTSS